WGVHVVLMAPARAARQVITVLLCARLAAVAHADRARERGLLFPAIRKRICLDLLIFFPWEFREVIRRSWRARGRARSSSRARGASRVRAGVRAIPTGQARSSSVNT